MDEVSFTVYQHVSVVAILSKSKLGFSLDTSRGASYLDVQQVAYDGVSRQAASKGPLRSSKAEAAAFAKLVLEVLQQRLRAQLADLVAGLHLSHF